MDKILTLGSLFDGIGGFPLCAEKNKIKTLWASEIEPFPIAVSKQHFPETNFYGDIKSLKGKYLEKVDVITAGSPCQDVSIAGKRVGLSGNRSGLFMEMIRIIKEMREIESKTKFEEKEIKPRILLWENVPGIFSSNKGQDFRTVLEQICKIKYETISIPMPAKNKWNKSGCIVGNNFSLAWRVLNAQYFGVAQRRKRVFLVADFGGQSAPKILFEPYCLSRDTSKSTKERENSATSCKTSIGKTSKDSNIKYSEVAKNSILSVLPFDTSFCTYLNSHNNPKYGDPCHTISADSHIPKIAINHNYYPKDKIDYLQLMRSNSKHDNRNREIGAISRELKKLATDLNVPILCLSQLNRVSNENTRPTSSELRDSGELEQNCNKLMLIRFLLTNSSL